MKLDLIGGSDLGLSEIVNELQFCFEKRDVQRIKNMYLYKCSHLKKCIIYIFKTSVIYYYYCSCYY